MINRLDEERSMLRVSGLILRISISRALQKRSERLENERERERKHTTTTILPIDSVFSCAQSSSSC